MPKPIGQAPANHTTNAPENAELPTKSSKASVIQDEFRLAKTSDVARYICKEDQLLNQWEDNEMCLELSELRMFIGQLHYTSNKCMEFLCSEKELEIDRNTANIPSCRTYALALLDKAHRWKTPHVPELWHPSFWHDDIGKTPLTFLAIIRRWLTIYRELLRQLQMTRIKSVRLDMIQMTLHQICNGFYKIRVSGLCETYQHLFGDSTTTNNAVSAVLSHFEVNNDYLMSRFCAYWDYPRCEIDRKFNIPRNLIEFKKYIFMTCYNGVEYTEQLDSILTKSCHL